MAAVSYLEAEGFPFDGATTSAAEIVLLREVNRCTADTFAAFAAVLRREISGSTSPDVRASLERCEARIASFGRLHEALPVDCSADRLGVQRYAERLCEALAQAFLTPAGIRCEVWSDDAIVSVEHCGKLGLVIAELVMNAAKYAFRDRIAGNVKVALLDRGEDVICTVADDGQWGASGGPGPNSKILQEFIVAMGGSMAVRSDDDGTTVIVMFNGFRA